MRKTKTTVTILLFLSFYSPALILNLLKDIFERSKNLSYKSKFCLIFFLLLAPRHAIADTPCINNNPNIMNPNFNPTYNNNPTIATEINPQFITNTTSTINIVGLDIKNLTLTILQKTQEALSKENYDHAKQYIQQLLWEYRYNIAASTLATIYVTSNILLVTDYYYLKDTQRWSHWKSDCTFEHLCAIPQTELAQDLLRAIGKKHYNKKNPSDASHPLITFIEAIETEIKRCKRYLALTKIIKTIHLMPIFFTNDDKINQINRCLQRCLFIKHIFLSWLAERNLITKSLKKPSFDVVKSIIPWSYCAYNPPCLL